MPTDARAPNLSRIQRATRWCAVFATPVVTLLVTLLTGCGGAQEMPTNRVLMSERLMACETFAQELGAMDLDGATRAELDAAFERAETEAPICRRLHLEAATTPGERAIAAQEARKIPIQALLIEGAIEVRYEDGTQYCDILDEHFALLFIALAEIEDALLNVELSDEERRRLVELRDIELEGLDVLAVHRTENCT